MGNEQDLKMRNERAYETLDAFAQGLHSICEDVSQIIENGKSEPVSDSDPTWVARQAAERFLQGVGELSSTLPQVISEVANFQSFKSSTTNAYVESKSG